MKYKIEHRTLHFKQPAGTSRGVYHTRDVWYLHFYTKYQHTIGECAPLPDLSCDARPKEEYEEYLHLACSMVCKAEGQIPYEFFKDYPSILFGLEMAIKPQTDPLRPQTDPLRPSGTSPIMGRNLYSEASKEIPQEAHQEAHQEAYQDAYQESPHSNSSLREGSSPHYGGEAGERGSVGERGSGSVGARRSPLCRINGLVWMGTYEEMKARLEEKLAAGYHCVKLKIGAINFEDEIRLIEQVRRDFPREKVELRVDANGAFGRPVPNPSLGGRGVDSVTGNIDLQSVIEKLERLAQYDIHSIEQPIPQGHWEEMAELCERANPLRPQTDPLRPQAATSPMMGRNLYSEVSKNTIQKNLQEAHQEAYQEAPHSNSSLREGSSPHYGGEAGERGSLPIALDEELIGINMTELKIALLDTIRPQYIVLKPMLHGGFSGCDEWIRLAEERGIGWWATSALESNVGLAAIARWVAQYRPTMPQGLGTGLLYTDNTPPHTEIRGDELWWIG